MADSTQAVHVVTLPYVGGRWYAIMPITGFMPVVKYKIWGAGGGAGGWDSPGQGGDGAGGGFVEGIAVVEPGQLIEVYNGQGGWAGGGGRGSSLSGNNGNGGSSLRWTDNNTDPQLVNRNLSTTINGVPAAGTGPALGFGTLTTIDSTVKFVSGTIPLLKNFQPDSGDAPTHDIIFRLPAVTQSHLAAMGVQTPFSQVPLVKDVMSINWTLNCNAAGRVDVGVYVWRNGKVNRDSYTQISSHQVTGGTRAAVHLSGNWPVPSGLDPTCAFIFAVGDITKSAPTGIDSVSFTANSVIPESRLIADYSGGRGGYPGWSGSSGQGGGGGGASVLKIDNAVVAVAGGGGGGGGGGHRGDVHGQSAGGIISPNRDVVSPAGPATVQRYNIPTGSFGFDKPGDGGGGGGGGGGAQGGIGGSFPGGDQGAYAGATGTNGLPGLDYKQSGLYSIGIEPAGLTDPSYPGVNVGYGGYRIPAYTSAGGNGYTELTFYRAGDFFTKINGDYRPIRAGIKVNGAWSSRTAQWVKIGGEWKTVNGSAPVAFTSDNVNWGGNGFQYVQPATEPVYYGGGYEGGGGDTGSTGDADGGGGGGGGGGCFTGDTLINLADNKTKRIDEIQVGDLVVDALTGNLNRVIGVKSIEHSPGRKIFATKAGVKPFITEEHAFYNEHNELCAISELCEYLAPWLGTVKIVDVPVVEVEDRPILVYNLIFETGNSHYANGVPVNNMVGHGGTYILYQKGFITFDEYQGYIHHLENTVGLNSLTQEQKARVFNIVFYLTKYVLNNNNIRSWMVAKLMSWAIKHRNSLYPYLDRWFKSRIRNWIFKK